MLLSTKTRLTPIFYPHNTQVIGETIFHIPQGYTVDFVPKDYKLTTDIMELDKSYQKEGGTVIVNDLVLTKRAEIPADRYKEVQDFWNEYYKHNDQYIILKTVKDASTGK